jgi:hypothetical protein
VEVVPGGSGEDDSQDGYGHEHVRAGQPDRHVPGQDAGNPKINGTISAVNGASSVSLTLRAASQALPAAGASLAT